MSRIGNKPIEIPEKVEINIDGNKINVKGSKGEMVTEVLEEKIKFEISDNVLQLYRSLVANNIVGVSEGYSKTLTLQGVGHRVTLKGNDLEILCGFSHPVIFKKVENITFDVPDQNTINVSGIDKALVGQVAADIRSIKPPEPYKGKGIRYQDEYVRRKAGKAAVATTGA